jgi:heat shock protein HslJ
MKKNIYIVLSIVTTSLLLYTGYYTYTHTGTPSVAVVATSTPQVATSTIEDPHTKTLTTKTGKTITIKETNPVGESLSTITITPAGFATNTPITLEKNKLTDSFLLDMNKDTFDELVLITTAQGSGSYGEATIFTTTKDGELLPVKVPDITEDDTKKGSLFEGYTGHDSFSIVNGVLVREFPTSNASDTNSLPTGPKRKVIYNLNEKDGAYSVVFAKDTMTTATTTSTTTTPLATATTTPVTKASTTIVSTLPGTSWVWASAVASGTTITAPKGNKFVITFDKGTAMHSTTDCNSLSGEYIISKDTVRFGALTSTLMFCEGSQESVYSELLSKARFFKIQDNTLTFILSDKGTMAFTLKK